MSADQIEARSPKLRAAIESVFRLTHGRQMTAAERRAFGITATGDGSGPDGTRSNHNGHKPDGKARGSEDHHSVKRRRA